MNVASLYSAIMHTDGEKERRKRRTDAAENRVKDGTTWTSLFLLFFRCDMYQQ